MSASLLLAALVAVGCVWASYRALRKLQRADGRELEKLGVLPRAPTLSALVQRVARLPSGDLQRAIEAVLQAEDAGQAVYAVTEISLMAQSEVRRMGYVPRVAGRVSMAAGTLLSLVILSESLGAGQVALPLAAVAFSAGVVGAAGCALLGRQLELLIEQRRAAWTGLLDALGTVAEDIHLPTVEIADKNPAVDLEPQGD